MHSNFENNDDFEAYRQEIDECADYDETKKQRLLDEMHEIVRNERHVKIRKINADKEASKDNQPYLPAFMNTDEKKRRNIRPLLKKWASMAAVLALVASLCLCILPMLHSSGLKSVQASDGSRTDSLSETSRITESANQAEQTAVQMTTQETENGYVIKDTANDGVIENTAASAATEAPGEDIINVPPKSTTFTNNHSSTDVCTSSHDECSDDMPVKPIPGILSMSTEEMHSEIDTVELRKYYDFVDGQTSSVPSYDLDFDKFYDIIKIIKNYDWTLHKDYINPCLTKDCEITVIGNNTVYTYLRFGKDENGRYFVWSFYDYAIAYLSEQDYDYIEDIFHNVS